MRWHATGDPGPVGLKRRADHSPCGADGCERENFANGYCQMHLYRVERYGDPGPAGPLLKRHPRPRKPDVECSVDGCDRIIGRTGGKGMCRLHHRRWRDTGDPGPAGLTRAAHGSGTTNGQGYRVLWLNGQYVKEHRHVMEQILGRPLWPDEEVHHKNLIRHDNEPSNLELWATSQPRGGRVEDLVAFYVERYPDEARRVLRRLRKAG
jgi:hypothetical protein